MKVIPKKQRLEAYKYALTDLSEGLCIKLAESVYGSYNDAPWIGWHKCREYFPELKDINMPKYKWQFTKKQRKQILTKAIKQCTTPSPSH